MRDNFLLEKKSGFDLAEGGGEGGKLRDGEKRKRERETWVESRGGRGDEEAKNISERKICIDNKTKKYQGNDTCKQS